MYIAHYAAENITEEFETFEMARKWLEEVWADDCGVEGFAVESIAGQDYIAKVTHFSKFVEIENKQKDGYVWDEEECASVNPAGKIWPVSEEFDFYGDMILDPVGKEK
jgi:hypothetical protein